MAAFWNPWHGCTKISPGCQNCYMFRRDAKYGKDSTVVTKNKSFNQPVKKDRHGAYKIPSGETIYTCFTSDFFHPDADDWRADAWAMIKVRSDCQFYFITKRPNRFYERLPDDWEDGYDHVTICCTCENQELADTRLPIFLNLPIKHKEIIHEPMLGPIDITPYLKTYHRDIECVTVGGESGEGKRIRKLDYAWVCNTKRQCDAYQVPFHFHQTGSYFKYRGKLYHIPRQLQAEQAQKSGLNA